MAKKARKKSAARRTKTSRKKSKSAPKRKKNIAKRRSKPRKSKIERAYSAVIDTFEGTDKLRNKMEQPGTSESE